jgi:hypothetical protein
MAIAISVLGLVGIYRLGKFWRVSILPMTALTPTLIVAGLVLYLPLSPLYIRSDGEYYQRWGFALAESWLTGESMDGWPPIWPGKGVWPLIIGGLSAIAGPVTISLIVVNALLLVLSAVLLQKATLLLGGRSPRWTMVVAFLSSSPFLLWGPSLLREALFWVGIALGVLALSYASSNQHIPAFSAAGASALVLLGIRPDAGVVLTYGFMAMLIFVVGIVGRKRSWPRVTASSVALLLLAISFPFAFDLVREGVTGETIVIVSEDLSQGMTTAFQAPTDSTDPTWCESEAARASLATSVLCGAATNLPHALFGPFLWEYGPDAIWFIAGASTLHFLVLVGLAGYHIVVSKGRRWPSVAILAVAVASMLMFSSILTNYGILIRFRAATEIMLIPLAILGALSLMSKIKSSRMKRSVSDSSEGSSTR